MNVHGGNRKVSGKGENNLSGDKNIDLGLHLKINKSAALNRLGRYS